MNSATQSIPLQLLEANTPHYTGAAEGRFMAQRCMDCAALQLPARPRCRNCHGQVLRWEAIRPTGTVRTWCRFHRAYIASFAQPVPYTVVVVDMDDGLSVYACLIDTTTTTPARLIGARVAAVFEAAAGGITLAHFRLTGDNP